MHSASGPQPACNHFDGGVVSLVKAVLHPFVMLVAVCAAQHSPIQRLVAHQSGRHVGRHTAHTHGAAVGGRVVALWGTLMT